jgi:hypothetical protein
MPKGTQHKISILPDDTAHTKTTECLGGEAEGTEKKNAS